VDGTEFTGGSDNEKTATCALTVRRADSSERVLKPRHIVFATGVSAIPIMPDLGSFAGTPGLER
jgi:hypothetical protein